MTTDDWRDHPRVREDHDDLGYTDRDAELDRWLGYGIWAMAALAVWKFLDLAAWSLGAFAGLVGWLLTRLS